MNPGPRKVCFHHVELLLKELLMSVTTCHHSPVPHHTTHSWSILPAEKKETWTEMIPTSSRTSGYMTSVPLDMTGPSTRRLRNWELRRQSDWARVRPDSRFSPTSGSPLLSWLMFSIPSKGPVVAKPKE